MIRSRHRLVQPYRTLLAVFWLLPVLLLIGAIAIGQGMHMAFFDPRLLAMLGLMALPALYVWQEGVDVREGGLVVRMHWPRYYPYGGLQTWHISAEPRLLRVWEKGDREVMAVFIMHLSDDNVLLDALRENLRGGERG